MKVFHWENKSYPKRSDIVDYTSSSENEATGDGSSSRTKSMVVTKKKQRR